MDKVDKYLTENLGFSDKRSKEFEKVGNEYIRIGKLIIQGGKKKQMGTLSNMDIQIAKNKYRWDSVLRSWEE
jgi:hypothetical protein